MIALWGLARDIREKGRFFYRGIVIGAGSAVLVLYYLLYANSCSGWSYSIRWFVSALPLLFFFLYPYLEAYGPGRVSQVRALLCVAIVIAFVGAIDPWSRRDLSEVPFIANIKEIPYGVHALRSVGGRSLPVPCKTCIPRPPMKQ